MKLTVFRDVQPSKAKAFTRTTPPPVTDSMDVLPWNAFCNMVVNVSGSVRDLMYLCPAKPYFPIDNIPSGT